MLCQPRAWRQGVWSLSRVIVMSGVDVTATDSPGSLRLAVEVRCPPVVFMWGQLHSVWGAGPV